MSILILYGTKTGTTEACALKIKAAIKSGNVEMVNLSKKFKGNLGDYDTIVIGTPLYMGKINGPVSRFFDKYKPELMNKKLHLFVCGMARGEEGVELFRKQVSGELFDHALQVKQLGGDVHLERLNPLYKMIMKKVLQESKPELGLLEDEITQFAKNI